MSCVAFWMSFALSGCFATPNAEPLAEDGEDLNAFAHLWSDGPTCFEHDGINAV